MAARRILTAMRRAHACFALARSTTYPAEREAAIERGIAIAMAAGIELDVFDIPGRTREPGREWSHWKGHTVADQPELMPSFYGHRASGRWGGSLAEALASLEDAVERGAVRIGAADDDDMVAAYRRAFDRAAEAARARDARREART